MSVWVRNHARKKKSAGGRWKLDDVSLYIVTNRTNGNEKKEEGGDDEKIAEWEKWKQYVYVSRKL